MTGKRLVCFFVFAATLLCCGQSFATEQCGDPCINCWADPLFVQRDARNPAMLPLLRKFAPPEIQEEGVLAIVVLSDTCCGEAASDVEASGEAEEPKRRVVLIGNKGSRARFEVTGALPPEVQAVVTYK